MEILIKIEKSVFIRGIKIDNDNKLLFYEPRLFIVSLLSRNNISHRLQWFIYSLKKFHPKNITN